LEVDAVQPERKLVNLAAEALSLQYSAEEWAQLRKAIEDGTAAIEARSDGKYVEVRVGCRRVLVVSVEELFRTRRYDA
jgi:hypothetical protein